MMTLLKSLLISRWFPRCILCIHVSASLYVEIIKFHTVLAAENDQKESMKYHTETNALCKLKPISSFDPPIKPSEYCC